MAEEILAVLTTNHGDITVKLFPDHAPTTVANFVDLAEGKRARQHQSGHSYSLEKFGLDAGAIRSGLAELFDRYGWD